MKRLLIALLFFVALIPGFADDGDTTGGFANGRFWAGISLSAKITYLRGVLDGIGLVNALSAAPVVSLTSFSGITLGELEKIVDSFYADAANSRLQVVQVIRLARIKVNGASAQEIESELSEMRKIAAKMKP